MIGQMIEAVVAEVQSADIPQANGPTLSGVVADWCKHFLGKTSMVYYFNPHRSVLLANACDSFSRTQVK